MKTTATDRRKIVQLFQHDSGATLGLDENGNVWRFYLRPPAWESVCGSPQVEVTVDTNGGAK